jgi:uncharacterized protein with von Willebrand factor type A (vWA) domain
MKEKLRKRADESKNRRERGEKEINNRIRSPFPLSFSYFPLLRVGIEDDGLTAFLSD